MTFTKLFQGKDAETEQMVDVLVAHETGVYWVGGTEQERLANANVRPHALAPDAEIDLESAYRHFKGGRYRPILRARYLARPEETAVVYVSLIYGTIWVRSAKAWLEKTNRWPDGRERHRFQVESAALAALFA